jgi:hypothetical protein
MIKGVISIEHSRLVPYLEKKGYSIFNHSIFNLPGHKAIEHDFFYNMQKGILTQQTLSGRFKKDIWWNFTMRNWRTGDIELPGAKSRTSWLQTSVYQEIQGLQQTVDNNQAGPKFVYCHVMLPHEPYYFNRDGSFVSDSAFFYSKEYKKNYLNQLIYTNGVIKSVINFLFKHDQKNKIIILEGDHGFRDFGQRDKANRIFDNLQAIYFYDNNYSALYNSMTPVNTFRVVLNQYFHEQLPYLPDTSILINDPMIDIGQNNRQ